MDLHSDLRDLLEAFANCEVEYLVVGGYAVGFHARPRFTKDLDVWFRGDDQNRARLEDALRRFGAPDEILDSIRQARADEIVWMGRPPVRVDFLQDLPGLNFDECWKRRVRSAWEGVPVSIIAMEDLIANKRAAGRDQDLLDVSELERARGRAKRSGERGEEL